MTTDLKAEILIALKKQVLLMSELKRVSPSPVMKEALVTQMKYVVDLVVRLEKTP